MSKSSTDNNAKRIKNNKSKLIPNTSISKLKYSKMMRGELYEKISSQKFIRIFFLKISIILQDKLLQIVK
jgi:hypothetical protein